MRKKYWAVAYATSVRYAGPVETAVKACLEAFGIVDHERMTVREFPSNPKYLPQYKLKEFLESLAKRHLEKTGNKL